MLLLQPSQSATIDWTSPSASAGSNSTTLRSIHSDDVVKVDVWDVVDKAIHTQQNSLNRHSTADLVYNFNQAGEAELSYGGAHKPVNSGTACAIQVQCVIYC